MQKRHILAVVLSASGAFAVAMPARLSAQSATVSEALALKPIQNDVEYEKPSAESAARCTIQPIKDNGWTGWELLSPDGRTLGRFADTNGDGQLDLWSYYQGGVEVYRDVDSDFDRRADQYRWLGTAGTRIGLDPNQDRKIDAWKVISAQEATAELVAAIAANDVARFERLLISEEEVKQLGVGEKLADRLSTKRRQAVRDFPRFVRDQKTINSTTRWVHFAANMPGTVPAGANDVSKDLTVFENAVAMFESDQGTGQLAVGTIVKVDDAWRLIDLPQISGTDVALADSAGFFFSGAASALNNATSGGISADLQKLVTDLEKIDLALAKATGDAAEKLHEQRADVMEQIIAASDKDQQEAWFRQLIDTIGAAVETNSYPSGVKRLQRISESLAGKSPALQAYVDFQLISSEYSLRISKAADRDFAEIQEWHITALESFADKHPGTIEEARAMLMIGLAKEFEDDTKGAVAWYTKVATNFRNTDEGLKAAGAIRRLESVGRQIAIEGKTLDNRAFTLNQMRGKVVVLHYWATWCEPCKQDMKLLMDLQNRYRKAGLEIVGINVDGSRNDAVRFEKEARLPWINLFAEGGLDSSPLANVLGVQTLPTMLLVDTTGKVVENNVPASQLSEAIEQLLREKR